MHEKSAQTFSTLKLSTFFMVVAAGLAFNIPLCTPAFADDIDPFQFDTSHWASFDHYIDQVKRGHTVADDPINAPAKDAGNKDAAQIALPTVAAPATAPTTDKPKTETASVVAPPSRPLDLPVLPGVNKGYEVKVNSTEDDAVKSTVHVTDPDNAPSIQLPQHNWQDAAEAAHQTAAANKNDDDSEMATQPLHIRMTFLPNLQIKPEPPQAPSSNHGRAPNAVAAAMSTPLPSAAPKKSPSEVAACAALDAYKKQELEAIQSDRQTLAALQKAISSLGLQKQLSFMEGAQGSVGTEAQNMSGNMDTPVLSH